VAAAGTCLGIGYGGKVGEQVRGFGLLEFARVGLREVGVEGSEY
jgi:hypothetical protein